MNLKLMVSTFALIFLAELGDKTQLAALASSAGSRHPWSVYVGASAALLLSTLIAVALGNTFNRFAADYQHIVRGVAGALFIVMGILLIAAAVRAARPAPAGALREGPTGALARFALRMAAEFEESAATNYAQLAERAEQPALRELLETLAREDRGHLDHVRGLLKEHPPVEHHPEAALDHIPRPSELSLEGKNLLAEAREHERTMAEFYDELSRAVPVRSLQRVFTGLASEEREHFQWLEQALAQQSQESEQGNEAC